jgi:hypothetical protein
MKLLIVACFCLFSSASIDSSTLEGTWDIGEDNTIITIVQENGQWVGKIKSSDKPKAKVGKVILKDLKKVGDKWEGTVYSAKKKDWFDVVITPKGDVLELKVSAGAFSKTKKWKKV